jgi:hypothetical protein
MKIAPAGVAAVVIALASAGRAYAGGTSCDALVKLTLEKATVTQAEVVPPGAFKTPGVRWQPAERRTIRAATGILPRRGDAPAKCGFRHQNRSVDAGCGLER